MSGRAGYLVLRVKRHHSLREQWGTVTGWTVKAWPALFRTQLEMLVRPGSRLGGFVRREPNLATVSEICGWLRTSITPVRVNARPRRSLRLRRKTSLHPTDGPGTDAGGHASTWRRLIETN